jgi:multidrug transporter EmrE-like cation transporter
MRICICIRTQICIFKHVYICLFYIYINTYNNYTCICIFLSPGISYVFVGYILRTLLNAFLPLSTIAVLAALTIVFTMILEYLIFKKKFKKIIIICLFSVLSGVIICLFSANIIDEEFTIESLRPLFLSPTSLIYTLSLIIMILLLQEFLNLFVSNNFNSQKIKNENLILSYLGLFYLSFSSAVFTGKGVCIFVYL